VTILYIFQQLLSILLITKFRRLYAPISIIIFFVIFFYKENSFDLVMYQEIVIFSDRYEFLFDKLIDLISFFEKDNKMIITYYQLTYLLTASIIIFFFRESNYKLIILAVIFSSIAIMLGIHNNLRQGLASIFILLGILSYIHGYKLIAIIFPFLAFGFHRSTFLFIILIFVFSFIFFISYKNIKNKKKHQVMIKIYLITIFSSILTALSIIYLIFYVDNFTFINSNFVNYYMKDNEYSEFRTPLFIKFSLISIVLISTEYLMKFRSIEFKIDFFRLLRLFILSLSFSLSFSYGFSEISNRIFYLYYAIEMGLLCFLISNKFFNTSAVIICSYAFAFNIWNILGGL